MKQYITNTADTCWKDCLACLLEVKPSKVPDFVKRYNKDYMDHTREWLAKNFGKSIVYIPARAFMEAASEDAIRQNPSTGPAGQSIAVVSMAMNDNANHAVIASYGSILWDNGDNRSEEYGTIQGYFVLYDLETSKAKWIKKKKKHRKKKSENSRPVPSATS